MWNGSKTVQEVVTFDKIGNCNGTSYNFVPLERNLRVTFERNFRHYCQDVLPIALFGGKEIVLTKFSYLSSKGSTRAALRARNPSLLRQNLMA